MTIQTWDPNRVGGGTIELIQDPTTGVFTTNEVGFVKLPDLSLPEITQAAYDDTPDDGDPDDDTADPCPDGYKLVDGVCKRTSTSSGGEGGAGGGGYGGGGYSGVPLKTSTYDAELEDEFYREPTAVGKVGKYVHDMEAYEKDPYGQRVDTHDFEGVDFSKQRLARQPSDASGMEDVQGPVVQYKASDMIKEYKDRESKIRWIANARMSDVVKNKKIAELVAQRPAPPIFDRFSEQETEVKNYPTRPKSTFGELEPTYQGIAPQFGGTTLEDEFPSTTRPVPFGTSTDRWQGFTKDKVTTPDLKGVKEVGKDLIAKKFTDTLKINAKKATDTVIKGVKNAKVFMTPGMMLLEGVLGVTDADRMRQTTNKNALTSLGYKTRGGNVDAGRVAGNPAENVFAGMNMVSAKGDIMQGGRNRVNKRNSAKTQARIAKLSPERQKAFNDNTKNMQAELNAAQAKKNKQTMNQGRPGRDDGSSGGSRKIVCTMMNESYGFGLFRNKIWMKFHKDIAPEYQKGYHKLFLPLVSYAKQKGITNKIIKNILEHIAIHSTIDMRQTLRGKTHLLGRLYRKVILPLCYWVGKK